MKTIPLIRTIPAYVFITFVVVLMLMPFVWVISGSFKTQSEFILSLIHI